MKPLRQEDQGGALVAFQSDTLGQRTHSSPVVEPEKLRSLYNQISDVNSDVRKISHHLIPSVLEQLGLVHALEAYNDEFTRQQKFKRLVFL